MRGYVGRCGHMARMFSIGKSKEGRSMWALELSNNVGAQEAKPNARLVGNMHGDEPASRCLQVSPSSDSDRLYSNRYIPVVANSTSH